MFVTWGVHPNASHATQHEGTRPPNNYNALPEK